MLILGVVTGDTDPEEVSVHGLELTRNYLEGLPEEVRSHLLSRPVDELAPLVQVHDIEGLMMGG